MPRPNLSNMLATRAKASQAARQETDLLIDRVEDVILGKREREPLSNRVERIPLDKLISFHTAQIGFKAYDDESLQDLADSIAENGQLENIIVRPEGDHYEILAGANRTAAHRLLGMTHINAEVRAVDDAQAIIIATVTNLKRRQRLLPSERAFAYRALLDARRHQGKKVDTGDESQKSGKTTRDQVAAIFEVDRNIIQRYIRFSYLIEPLRDMLDCKKLNLRCGEILSYYAEDVQQAAFDLMREQEGKLSISFLEHIRNRVPADTADVESFTEAWQQEHELSAHSGPSKKIKFVLSWDTVAQYLTNDELEDTEELCKTFLHYLKTRPKKGV
ncbi:ParB/RepB/Spo0J family partition protein [Agathobaculum desmolans]|uniref:ParB/RepB/Spo0J family partition protein n=1 Tax=Agathobaculum desmolans TaxID=39484 RepID=UPI00248F29D8|nr:ParB/RepB/Spo0J family partition protein [Agathobaculum desmolans]